MAAMIFKAPPQFGVNQHDGGFDDMACSAVAALDMDVSAAVTHHWPCSRLEADTPYDGERNRRTGSLVAAIPSAITSGS
jgi:hypothetical protein